MGKITNFVIQNKKLSNLKLVLMTKCQHLSKALAGKPET